VRLGPFVRAVAGGALVLAGLTYLYDPPWLAGVESGLRGWEIANDNRRYRWTSGHASFFVPSSATAIGIPLRTTFAAPENQPMTVAISVDDRLASTVVLREDEWQTTLVTLPAKGRRSLRRIDVRVDRIRNGNRGVQLGEVEIRR
jgi:hypothetical protein